MDKFDTKLQQLWQQQPTLEVDISQLANQWRKAKWRQRSYAFFDLLSVIIMPVFMWMSYGKMHVIQWLLLCVMAIGGMVFGGYMLWLRRAALFHRTSTTQGYLRVLKDQSRRNVRIGHMTKRAIIAFSVFFVFFWGISAWVGDYTVSDISRRAGLSIVILGVCYVPLWLWANFRINRYTKELERLTALSSQQDQ